MAENFSNLEEEIGIQVQEAKRVPNKINPKTSTPRCIVIKVSKVKKNPKISKRKTTCMFKGNLMKLLADFSAETLQVRREWHNVFTLLKGRKCSYREYST